MFRKLKLQPILEMETQGNRDLDVPTRKSFFDQYTIPQDHTDKQGTRDLGPMSTKGIDQYTQNRETRRVEPRVNTRKALPWGGKKRIRINREIKR